MSERPLVGIVVLNYNGFEDTVECVRSVEALAYEPVDVLIVDNASAGCDAERLALQFPQHCVMPLPQNTGYSGGNNLGFRHELERGAAYILVLNNDTIVPTDLVDRLVDVMERHHDCGVCGATMLDSQVPDSVVAIGGQMDFKGRCFNLFEGMPVAAATEMSPFDVEFVHGSAIMFRASTLERVGLFDERYFLNYEELDLCTRIRDSGERVMAVPAATYWHKLGASIGRSSSTQRYYMTRNRLLFLAHHHRWRALALSGALTILHLPRAGDRTLRRAQLQGVVDFARGAGSVHVAPTGHQALADSTVERRRNHLRCR